MFDGERCFLFGIEYKVRGCGVLNIKFLSFFINK